MRNRQELARIMLGQGARQLRADQLKWEAVAEAMGESLVSAEERSRRDAPKLKATAPRNRAERRAEQKRRRRTR